MTIKQYMELFDITGIMSVFIDGYEEEALKLYYEYAKLPGIDSHTEEETRQYVRSYDYLYVTDHGIYFTNDVEGHAAVMEDFLPSKPLQDLYD